MAQFKFPEFTVLALKENEKIPKGWVECDGTNGTPDLRGRFILGVGSLDELLGNCSLNPLEIKGSDEQLKNEIKYKSEGGFTEVELRKEHLPIHRHTSITPNNLEYDTKYITKRFHGNVWVGGQNNWFDNSEKIEIENSTIETPTKINIRQINNTINEVEDEGSVIASGTDVSYLPDIAMTHYNMPPYHSLKYIMNLTDVE
jgi:microcystin-dependent protein